MDRLQNSTKGCDQVLLQQTNHSLPQPSTQMTNESPELIKLRKANQDAHRNLDRLTRGLIAIAGAIGFARAHFSDDDEWTKNDELISRMCGPLEEILQDMSLLVANAKVASDKTSNAVSEYYKAKNAAKLQEDN